MTLKSPRRRGSPRPRRRYFTLSGFFRRTLSKSNSSRSNINRHSEEHYQNEPQLHEEIVLKSDSYPVLKEISKIDKEVKSLSSRRNCKYSASDHQNSSNTKILFKTKKQSIPSDECSDNKIHCLDNNIVPSKPHIASSNLYNCKMKQNEPHSSNCNPVYVKSESIHLRKMKSYNRRRDKKNETSTSFNSLSQNPPAYSYKDIHPSGDKRTLVNLNTNYKPVIDRYRTEEPLICHEDVLNYHSAGQKQKDIDDKYIERLIRKQYKQKQIVNGNNESEFSQFSAPICRDNVNKLRKIHEEYYDNKYKKYYSELESMCDTKLHNRRVSRNKHRSKYTDMYNDSDLYDVIPVREKSSCEYHCLQQTPLKYTDVPPSPKTHRPKLNLEPHYVSEDYGILRKKLQKDTQNCVKNKNDLPCDKTCRRDSNINVYSLDTRQINNSEKNSHLTATPTIDQTSNVLNEIKDVLNTFLVDMRKDTSTQNEQKSFMSTPKTNDQLPNFFNDTSLSGNQIRNDFNNYSGPPYIQQYNPCYPAVPFYPMQNAYVIPSCSLTCSNCIHSCSKNYTKKVSSEPSIKSTRHHQMNHKDDDVTRELIKEIYKCVTLNKNENKDTDSMKHEKRVRKSKCSKSCEAFGSKILSESSVASHSIMSDTRLLDRRSVDGTVAPSQSILSTDSATTIQKKKHNKFRKFLQTIGLGKSKRVEEYDSKHSIPHYINNPYKQDVLNYMVHDQEFYNHPIPPYQNLNIQHQQTRPPRPDPMMGDYNYRVPHAYHDQDYANPYYKERHTEMKNRPQMHSNPYGGPPVCFKEIEVRSTATQSYTKNKSFFSAFRRKYVNTKNIDEQNNISTQTQKNKEQFSWKNNDIDPLNFTLKQNQKMAEGDITMRNAILKKLFKKRNPFSPNNLLIKTLLGKDKSSYGEPKMFKPRLFF